MSGPVPASTRSSSASRPPKSRLISPGGRFSSEYDLAWAADAPSSWSTRIETEVTTIRLTFMSPPTSGGTRWGFGLRGRQHSQATPLWLLSTTVTSQRALQPQDQIAHYRIVGPLGAGGMGEVYLAQDQTLERNVALKILPPELVRSEDRVRRFVREAKSASSLNHPNIITIYEIGEDRVRTPEGEGAGAAESGSTSVHFISMELVSGETLTTKIHHDKTDLRTLLGYLAQAAEGLAKAHAAGIVHRDLKPGNIMVSKDGFAKV